MTTIPLPEPGDPSIEDHLAISRRFLDHARVELDKGDRLQAAEKVWGSAAHALKAIAIQRGWRHRSHDSVMSVGSQLAREFDREDLAEHLISANAMHINFYENGVPAILIKAAINNVERYIAKLDNVRSLPPRARTVLDNDERTDLRRLLGWRPDINTYSPAGFSQTHPEPDE